MTSLETRNGHNWPVANIETLWHKDFIKSKKIPVIQFASFFKLFPCLRDPSADGVAEVFSVNGWKYLG